MIKVSRTRIKKVTHRTSYAGRLVTRVIIDFDSERVNRDKLDEVNEWWLKRRDVIIEMKLDDANASLFEYEEE